MAETRLVGEVLDVEGAIMPQPVARRPYSPPCSVQLSGGKGEEYGAAIGAVAVWVIGIGIAWIW